MRRLSPCSAATRHSRSWYRAPPSTPFGFARIGPAYGGEPQAVGNAFASVVQGSHTVTSLPPAEQPAGGSLPGGAAFPDPTSIGIGVTVSGLSISGWAAPDGWAKAKSTAELRFNFANLTGSSAPTPPAQVIVAPISGSYTFAQSATAGGCTECEEESQARFRFVATDGTRDYLNVFEQVSGSLGDPTVPFDVLVTLSANDITRLTFEMTIEGEAASASIIKNPEPGSLAALAAGLAALGFGRSIRSNRRAAADRQQA